MVVVSSKTQAVHQCAQGIGCLGCTVNHWGIRILAQLFPVFGEGIGIIIGMGSQGVDFTCCRVHEHHSAFCVTQQGIGGGLQSCIDGQFNIHTRRWLIVKQLVLPKRVITSA